MSTYHTHTEGVRDAEIGFIFQGPGPKYEPKVPVRHDSGDDTSDHSRDDWRESSGSMSLDSGHAVGTPPDYLYDCRRVRLLKLRESAHFAAVGCVCSLGPLVAWLGGVISKGWIPDDLANRRSVRKS